MDKISIGDKVQLTKPHYNANMNTLYKVEDIINNNNYLISHEEKIIMVPGDQLIRHYASDYPTPVNVDRKDGNPKDAVGIKKIPFSTASELVTAEVNVGMMEGARKYGRHNYRVSGVRASVYYDATRRHLSAWWEGEDIDPGSGLSHITKAICSLYVLRDAMINDMWNDDRPPKAPEKWMNDLQKVVDEIFEKYPESLPPYTEKAKDA